jgi:CspA family cold shock protein
MKGIVKWFSDKKGFGFITDDVSSSDVFVHYSKINMEGRKCLVEGDRVTYESKQGLRGPEAVNVTKDV